MQGRELTAYVDGGAETETTLRRNRHALDTLAWLPRVLNDVSSPDPSSTLFGTLWELPVLLAPVGSLHLLQSDSVRGAAAVAQRHGVGYAAGSAVPESSRLQVPAGSRGVYQLYVEGDAEWVRSQVLSARDRGFSAVIITVDAPVFPVRRRDVAADNHAADRSKSGTSAHRKQFTWQGFEQLVRDTPGLPLILKGIQHPDDALRAFDAGAAAIYLSNHGGRQLDHGPGAIDLVAPVAKVIGGRIPLIVDGGFASGIDVLKAIAAGADAVGIGRAWLHPYAEGGQEGLSAWLTTLAAQVRTAMALLGTPTLADVRRIELLKAQHVGEWAEADHVR